MLQEGPGLHVLWTWSVAAKLLSQRGQRHSGAECRAVTHPPGARPQAQVGRKCPTPHSHRSHQEEAAKPAGRSWWGLLGGTGQGPGSLTPPISQEGQKSYNPHPQSPKPTRGWPRVLGRQQALAKEQLAHPRARTAQQTPRKQRQEQLRSRGQAAPSRGAPGTSPAPETVASDSKPPGLTTC